MFAYFFINAFSILTAIQIVNASGMIAQVKDATDFCVFLPPKDSTDRIISNTEWNANAFCMGDTPLAVGADKMPDGFILSAHYVKTDLYVQITGQMDYTKANLVGTDEGGQMDVKAPDGSSCAGWQYYVNLIEPVSNTYCMRCCNDTKSCNRGISEKGCAHIIPGDYSGPNDGTGSGINTSSVTSPINPTTRTSASLNSITTISSTSTTSITTTTTTITPTLNTIPVTSDSQSSSVSHIPSSNSSSSKSDSNDNSKGEITEQALSKGSSLDFSSAAVVIVSSFLICILTL